MCRGNNNTLTGHLFIFVKNGGKDTLYGEKYTEFHFYRDKYSKNCFCFSTAGTQDGVAPTSRSTRPPHKPDGDVSASFTLSFPQPKFPLRRSLNKAAYGRPRSKKHLYCKTTTVPQELPPEGWSHYLPGTAPGARPSPHGCRLGAGCAAPEAGRGAPEAGQPPSRRPPAASLRLPPPLAFLPAGPPPASHRPAPQSPPSPWPVRRRRRRWPARRQQRRRRWPARGAAC